MSLCKDITWRDNDYYKRNNYFSDYEYDEKRKSSSNDLWTTASNLCKRKSYITIAKYIASNLPYPPDECILENLHEMVLVEALERIDLNATEFREKIVLNTSSEALLKAASKYNLCLSDEVVNSFISNPSKQHIAKELCYSYSISPSHWLAFNEATNDQPSLTELVDHIDMYSGIYRREGFCPVDYHDAALIVFARSLVDKSKGSKYYYLDYDDELPFPFGFIDLVTFRWLKASRYHHLLAIAKRTVQACSKYVDVNSVWKTYLNIKASNITITSLLLLVPKLVYLDKKDGKSTVSDYERLTKSNFDKLPKHTTTTSLSYYIASTLRELPTYISSLQRNAHNNLLKDITILILICTISILLFK